MNRFSLEDVQVDVVEDLECKCLFLGVGLEFHRKADEARWADLSRKICSASCDFISDERV